MFEVFRSFLFDGATFKRVMSDATATVGIIAVTPEVLPTVSALFPGAGWLPPLLILAGGVYSARARQQQFPPRG